MYDWHTAMQIALSPVVTLSVIAALAIGIVAQALYNARRMKVRSAQLARFVKATAMLVMEMAVEHKRDTERQIGQAIEATFDALKDVGFDKLASGEVSFEGVMFGGSTPKSESFRRRTPARDLDPFASFSMAELAEALGGKPRYSGAKSGEPFKAGNHSDAHFEEPVKNAGEGAGLGDKGPRPFHAATHDFSGHSPRAG
jgi:hypothetical protein